MLSVHPMLPQIPMSGFKNTLKLLVETVGVEREMRKMLGKAAGQGLWKMHRQKTD